MISELSPYRLPWKLVRSGSSEDAGVTLSFEDFHSLQAKHAQMIAALRSIAVSESCNSGVASNMVRTARDVLREIGVEVP